MGPNLVNISQPMRICLNTPDSVMWKFSSDLQMQLDWEAIPGGVEFVSCGRQTSVTLFLKTRGMLRRIPQAKEKAIIILAFLKVWNLWKNVGLYIAIYLLMVMLMMMKTELATKVLGRGVLM